MISFGAPKIQVTSERLLLRLGLKSDYQQWSQLRARNQAFLTPWEPTWARDHLTIGSFHSRIALTNTQVKQGAAVPFLIFEKNTETLMGAITMDNIRKGVSQSCTIGYWIGEEFTRQGYMLEALDIAVQYAFQRIDISRIRAGCLPNNAPSRNLLEKFGFKYEGVAQSYLQIDGRWRSHVLYSHLRDDRRGVTDAGIEA